MAVGDVYESVPGRGNNDGVKRAIALIERTQSGLWVEVAEGLTATKAGDLVTRLKVLGYQASQRSAGEAGQRVFASGTSVGGDHADV